MRALAQRMKRVGPNLGGSAPGPVWWVVVTNAEREVSEDEVFFIARPQRMSLTKAHCSSYATGPKDWDLKRRNKARQTHKRR